MTIVIRMRLSFVLKEVGCLILASEEVFCNGEANVNDVME